MEMKRDVLFVHGGGEGAHEADEELAASLRNALGGGYDVRSPKMPDEDNPEVGAWKGKIAGELAAMDGEAILVGHSVGAHILLKYLSEEEVEKPVAGLFLVAAPYAGTGGWELEDYALPEDFASKLPRDLPIFFYHGRDDEVAPFGHPPFTKRISRARPFARPTAAGTSSATICPKSPRTSWSSSDGDPAPIRSRNG
jgi:predicted alpha/beta hydrolase family esterase